MSQINNHPGDCPKDFALATGVSDEQVAEQMEKILASRHFRQAKSLEKFLRFVVNKKLAGGENELKNSNLIILASMRFQTLAKELPYPSHFAISESSSSAVINLHPQADEPASYGGPHSSRCCCAPR